MRSDPPDDVTKYLRTRRRRAIRSPRMQVRHRRAQLSRLQYLLCDFRWFQRQILIVRTHRDSPCGREVENESVHRASILALHRSFCQAITTRRMAGVPGLPVGRPDPVNGRFIFRSPMSAVQNSDCKS